MADDQRCELGQSVGYHIGNDKLRNECTKVLFCTCGIMLKDLYARGPDALSSLSVLIVDEVHER